VSPDQVLILIAIVAPVWAVTRILRGPLGDALARRLAGASQGQNEASPEVAELRARVAELEERVDFTERVLLQERQPGQLHHGDTA
jgi:hypothetical protein